MSHNSTKINKITKKVNKFYHSKWSFITLFSYLTFFAVLQIILFSFHKLAITGLYIDDPKSWRVWIYLSLSFPASILSFSSYILTIRGNKNFFYPSLISLIIYLLTMFISGLVWTAFGIFISLITIFLRFMLMGKYEDIRVLSTKKNHFIMIILSIIFLILGLIFINTPLNIIWWNQENQDKSIIYIDIFSSAIMTLGTLLLLIGSNFSFAVFIISNILFVVLFSYTHQILNIFQTFITIFFNFFATLSWIHKDK